MNKQTHLTYIAKGKPDTALAGKEFHLYLHKEVIDECWMSSVLYGGEPIDYLTPELLAKYPCPIQEHSPTDGWLPKPELIISGEHENERTADNQNMPGL